ncbi:MAG: hypothetical protein H6747_14490 [Deltaproteobacteria bacterium]|nr:hypothetical protein [Deltaproteobacteria bacterium]
MRGDDGQPQPEGGAAPDKASPGGCLTGCAAIFALFAAITIAPPWLVAAIDRARTPAALQGLVPFRGGFLGDADLLLTIDGDGLGTRLIVYGMFTAFGLLIGLGLIYGLSRIFGEQAADRVMVRATPAALLLALVFVLGTSLLLPRWPVWLDRQAEALRFGTRATFGPFVALGAESVRTVPFAAIEAFGVRHSWHTERGGTYRMVELYVRVQGGDEPGWTPLALLRLVDGELDLVSHFRSREAIDAEAQRLADEAIDALLTLTGPRPRLVLPTASDGDEAPQGRSDIRLPAARVPVD